MGIQFNPLYGARCVGVRMLLLRQSGLWQRLRAAPALTQVCCLAAGLPVAALIAGFILCVLFIFCPAGFSGVHVRGSFLGFLGVCAAFFADDLPLLDS